MRGMQQPHEHDLEKQWIEAPEEWLLIHYDGI